MVLFLQVLVFFSVVYDQKTKQYQCQPQAYEEADLVVKKAAIPCRVSV